MVAPCVPRFRLILVEPKTEGNVGAVARSMSNFDVDDFVLVNPPPLGNDAQGRAMHAWPLVQGARRVKTFAEAIEGCDLIVGTSAKIPLSEKSHIRNPIEARDLPRRLADLSGVVGLCFGREDFGLLNEELELCDVLVTIPTSRKYKSLNLSHAATIVLYELYSYAHPEPVKTIRPMSEQMRKKLQESFDLLIDQLNIADHKKKGSKIVYRRVFGRAVPSAWEYYVFMGIISALLAKYGLAVASENHEANTEFPSELEDLQALIGGDPSEPMPK